MANTERRAEPLKEFCESLGVSYDTGRRAVGRGDLRTIRFGNLILVPAEEIERISRDGLHGSRSTSKDGANKRRIRKPAE